MEGTSFQSRFVEKSLICLVLLEKQQLGLWSNSLENQINFFPIIISSMYYSTLSGKVLSTFLTMSEAVSDTNKAVFGATLEIGCHPCHDNHPEVVACDCVATAGHLSGRHKMNVALVRIQHMCSWTASSKSSNFNLSENELPILTMFCLADFFFVCVLFLNLPESLSLPLPY